MIIFKEFIDNNAGIRFESLENSTVIAKIIDGYTGLCAYANKMELVKDVQYFISHPVEIYHRRFEIWDSSEKNLYLKIDSKDNESVNLADLDKFGLLKDLIYDNKQDAQPSLPLYEIFCTGIYDRGEKCKVKEDDIVFDIGANIGLFSYYSICKGAREVHAFEPSVSSYSALTENFKFDNLYVENKAVSSYTGEIEFFNNPGLSTSSSTHIETEGSVKTVCQCVNLQEYIDSNNISRIDYLKIDCEGAEYEIIESLNENFLSSIRSLCIEYHLNYDGKLHKMIEKLERCGFIIEFEYDQEQINSEMGIFYAYKK